MAGQKHASPLSPTVVQVIDGFINAVRADDAIDNDKIDRLNKLLTNGPVPKPEDIHKALFGFPTVGAK